MDRGPATAEPNTRRGALGLLLALLAIAASPGHAADRIAPGALQAPGTVLMMRHALAPGTGDPGDFRLGDCSTQRNLDSRGRAQAEAIGARLREAGLGEARVYTSQWCRCRETAELLGLGPVTELPALNSFFQRPQDRAPNLAALRDFFAALPPDGPPVVLVTHQVTITAITGEWVKSGGIKLLRADGSGSPTQIGELDLD